MSTEIVPFTREDERSAAKAWEISRESGRVDIFDLPPTSLETFLQMFRMGHPGLEFEFSLAYLDGVPAGFLELQLPQLDNLTSATCQLKVAPRHRRNGVGRVLLDHAAARLRGLGRKNLVGETTDHLADGDAFAAAVGARPALAETRSRLDLATVEEPELAAMLAESWKHADGYRFIGWLGVPPERYIDDVAYLDSRFNTDAPTGDLDVEPEVVDAERVRAAEQGRVDRGFGRYHGGVVHEATDRLVAWTTLAGPGDEPGHLWQNITLVDPPHRGHRLGMIVKLENLRHARRHRPALRTIDTFNASANEHMLAINRAMGFRPVEKWMQWQLTV